MSWIFGKMDFTLQMMILVFGYALAIYKTIHFEEIIPGSRKFITSFLFIGLVIMVSDLINWCFGLVIGALLARFVYLALEEKGQE